MKLKLALIHLLDLQRAPWGTAIPISMKTPDIAVAQHAMWDWPAKDIAPGRPEKDFQPPRALSTPMPGIGSHPCQGMREVTLGLRKTEGGVSFFSVIFRKSVDLIAACTFHSRYRQM